MASFSALIRTAWSNEADDDPARLLVESALASVVLTVLSVLLSVAMPELFRAFDSRLEIELWAASTAVATLAVSARALSARRLGPAAIVATITAIVLVALLRELARTTWDYETYYRAGEQLRAGRDPYAWWHLAHGSPSSPAAEGAGGRYWYTPLLATVFAVLQELPDRAVSSPVFLAWTAISFWAACAFVVLLMSVLRHVYGWSVSAAALAALAFGAASTPVIRTLIYSQPNLLVADCLLGAILLLHHARENGRREAIAGALFAMAALLKTSPVLLLALFVLHRRFRLLVCTLLSGASVAALSMLVTGARPWLFFPRVASSVRSDGFFRDNSFESLFLASARLMGSTNVDRAHYAGLVAAIAVLVVLFLAGRSHGFRWPWTTTMPASSSTLARDVPVALVAMTLLSPVLWEHHWVWLALPCALVLPSARPRTFAAAALVFFIPTIDVFPFSYHRLFGALLLVSELARRPADRPSEATP